MRGSENSTSSTNFSRQILTKHLDGRWIIDSGLDWHIISISIIFFIIQSAFITKHLKYHLQDANVLQMPFAQCSHMEFLVEHLYLEYIKI